MVIINSPQNPLIKEVKLLKKRNTREEKKQFIIEGIKFIEECIKEHHLPVKVIISEAFKNNIIRNFDKSSLHVVSDKLFKEISDTETPQGIMAVVSYTPKTISDVINSSNSKKFLILDRIQDPGNMGTIIRSADAFGFSSIFCINGSVDVYNQKVLRSTMGSIFRVNIVQNVHSDDLFSKLSASGIVTYASTLDTSESILNTNFPDKFAVVIGNEANGVDEKIIKLCNSRLFIPMNSHTESLNAAVAASIIMFQSLRRS